ncbi:MAG: 4-hydroxythreonine-4-phosphate dehydrogenase PdxA [Pseudomonadota bacterium]
MPTASAPLALTMGDPAGCGPEITIAAWRDRAALGLSPFFVIADPALFEPRVPIALIDAPAASVEVFEDALPILPISIAGVEHIRPGHPDPVYADSIVESITRATQLCLHGEASAMVTNPISKAILYDAGFEFPGHTEYIGHLCAEHQDRPILPVMMLVGGGLRVALTTIHVPLMKVLDHLTSDRLANTAHATHAALARDFGVSEPKLAFTGLNPHAGEDGNIGTEEREIINPVAAALRQQGLNISDARPADTVFHEALSGQFDAVIAMTHDQGLIPVKTLDMWGGVNTTLGLPILRTSPDHGTAYDAAAAGTCRPDSLTAALALARTLANHRAQSDA